jgi:arylsulfatase A-like enzyme
MSNSDDPALSLAYCPGSRPHPYNVLVVVCDDLSARHIGTFGYERDTMPALEGRLASGTLFRNCNSPVGWTLPACASIITGQLPDDHGLFDHNRKFRRPKIGHYLGESYERYGITNNGNVVSDTIPREYLETLGFKRRPAKWRFFGWNSGFDRYDWVHREDHARPFELAQTYLTERRESESDKPYFLFFHSNLVHDYHMDRPEYLEVESWIDEGVHPDLRAVKDGPEIWRHPPRGVSWALEKRHLIAKYDSGVRAFDRKLDSLLSLVDFDTTIVVVMSDHGEGFEPEIGRVHHCGRLHGDLTHVPLAVWLPPELRARYEPPKSTEATASTIDVVPTILTLLGDAVAGFPGRFLFDLPVHRRLTGVDRGYVYWNEDCQRESYDTCNIEIRSVTTYPLKTTTARKNDTTKECAYNLAYDPLEHDNLLASGRGPLVGFEPISFVIAVNDDDETRHNFLASPIARSPHHEIFIVDNTGNCRYDSISQLYCEAIEEVAHDLVVFVHQDLYLSHGWEERFFSALAELAKDDPDWGVVGPVGALPVNPGQPKELRGHWCDPSGYHRMGPLPYEVESLDEQLLGVRRSSGVRFDGQLPGFHCYGIDLSLSARELGRKSYAIDCFAWHKFKDSRGYLVERRERSEKIQRRWSDEFMSEFVPGAEYVERKWKKYLPFQTTSWTWGAD